MVSFLPSESDEAEDENEPNGIEIHNLLGTRKISVDPENYESQTLQSENSKIP